MRLSDRTPIEHLCLWRFEEREAQRDRWDEEHFNNQQKEQEMKAEETDAVIALFDRAHTAAVADEDYGTQKALEASNAAFDAAKAAGWDWEKDEQFVNWCLKATDLEVLSEGKKRFLKEATCQTSTV